MDLSIYIYMFELTGKFLLTVALVKEDSSMWHQMRHRGGGWNLDVGPIGAFSILWCW